ncbi:MAG: porin family protein [Acidobacteriota bacterium]|nr:porin family protein [Acidobacteriota bacterium]
MKIAPLYAALALTAATALPAGAQTTAQPAVEPGSWTATPFLSLTFGGDGDSTSLGLGGAAAYDLTELWSVEGELGYVFDLAGDSESSDWSVLGLSGNALYHFPLENGFAPYATAGLTLARSHLTISDATADTAEFGVNLGGGIKMPLTDALTARGDLRYFKYIDTAPDGFRVYAGLSWRLRR